MDTLISRPIFLRQYLKGGADLYRDMREAGQLPPIRMRGRREYFLESEVVAWMKNLPTYSGKKSSEGADA